jgi:hypothetical protein
MASIAYEVTRGAVEKKKLDKFDKYFAKKVVNILEKNCMNVCNPHIDRSI